MNIVMLWTGPHDHNVCVVTTAYDCWLFDNCSWIVLSFLLFYYNNQYYSTTYTVCVCVTTFQRSCFFAVDGQIRCES